MGIKGDLKSLPLPSLLQIVEGERKSGVLTISYGRYQKKIFLKEGSIAFLVSDDPKDFFGHFLIRHQVITEGALAQALLLQANEKNPHTKIGAILSGLGKVDSSRVREHLLKKLQESIYELFLVEDAEFHLDEIQINWAEQPDIMLLPIREILMEGLRRLDEYELLKSTFPTDRQTFRVDRSKIGGELSVSEGAGKVLEFLESGATIEDLCLQFHTYEYDVLRQLEPFVEKGIITKDGVRRGDGGTASARSTSVLRNLLQTAEDRGEYLASIQICTDILNLEPGNQPVREQLKRIQGKLAAEITAKELPRNSILVLSGKPVASGTQFTPLDGFVLSRINGQWSVAEILAVVPMPEADVLISMKKLLQEGFIARK